MGDYYVIIIPALGGAIIGPLIYYLASEAKGTGIPEVMLAVSTQDGNVRPRVAVIKTLASSICIASGGSVGREGPIVQIGSSLGSAVGQLLHLSKNRKKILIACGSAAGISATFNAPLGGIFFALEVILREYGLRHFAAVVLASVSGAVVSRHFLGNFPAFKVPTYQLDSLWEMPLYLIFGFIIGLAALFFIKVLYKSKDLFDLIRLPDYLKPVIGGLIVGLLGFFYPEIFGVGYEYIELTLYGKLAAKIVLVVVLVKIIATSVTLGSGGSGGIFAPSLFVGAMLGEAYGKIIQYIIPGFAMPPGAAALVGMGAFVAGVTHAPISAIFILFELTGNYKIILPLMLTCVVATMIVRTMSRDSIYTIKLSRRGINLNLRRHFDLMEIIKVSEAMDKKVITVNENDPVRSAGLKIKSTSHRGFPVVDDNHYLVGMIARKDINKALSKDEGDFPVKDFMTRDITICNPGENLRIALEKLAERNIGRMPVVNPVNPNHVIGIITRKNIITAYNIALHEEEEDDTSRLD